MTSTTTGDGVQLGLANVLNIGASNPVVINGDTGRVSGLTNTTWDANNITSGQAATEDQLAKVSAQAAGAKATVNEGKNIKVTSTLNADGSTDYEVATADDVEFDSVTAGTGANQVKLDGTGVNVGGKTYITGAGLNANDQKITQVADGDLSAGSKDAVNGGQLFATNQNVAQNATNIPNNATNIAKGINFGDGSTANNYALGATINVRGDSNVTSTTTGDGVQLGLANVLNIGASNPVVINGDTGRVSGLTNTTWDANNITSGQAATEDQLAKVSAQAAGAKATVNEGKNIKVTSTLNADGSTDYEVATADDVEFDSVTAGTGANQVKLDGTGVNVGGKTYITGAGLNANDQKIVNVADGDLSAGSKDAVNG
ncbi:hypothetical protein CO614_04180, partial [Lysobacteraceae bacterium NML120232]